MSKYTILPKSSLGYEKVKLKTVCLRILGGGTPSTKNDTFWNGSIPWISSADIIGLREINPRRKITLEAINNSTTNILPKGGIIVVTRVGLGKLAIAPYDICFSQDNQGLILDETKISQSYALLCLSKAVEKFKHESRGTTINGVTKKQLEELEIHLPSLQEQEKLVSKIEELFSELDKSIETLRLAQQQLKTYRQAVLKWAFEGKLTEEWRKDNETKVQVSAGTQENYVASSGLEPELLAAEPVADYQVANSNGELPEGWKWVKISNIASLNPKLPNKENIEPDLAVQFLPMKLVKEIVNKIHLTEIKKFSEVQKGSYTPFIDGDVIFAKVTPCMENGKIAVVDKLKNGIGYGSSEFHVVRCESEVLNSYLFYFLVQDRFRNEAEHAMTGAVGLRRVPKQFIENHIIPLPVIEEQKKIVLEIESRISVADKMEESITQSLQQAEALRQSILKKAFEGKLIEKF